MGLFGGKSTASKQPSALLGYRVQTSIYGKPIPIVYGQCRIPGNVIWTGDWKANPVKASGGKGGSKGGGKGGSGGQQFTYNTAIAIALAQGPIQGIGYVWVDKIRMTINRSQETITVPVGLTYQVTEHDNFVYDNGVGINQNYSVSANDYGSPGTVTLTGVETAPLTLVPGSPAAGEYSYNPATGIYTFNAANVGATVKIQYTWADPNASVDGNPVNDLQFALFVGTPGQSPWAFLVTNHGDQALGYTSLAYLANENLDLGSSGLVSNYGFEVLGLLPFGAGISDAAIADVIADFLSDPLHGVGFPSGSIGSLTELDTYCQANGIFISQAVDSAQSAASWLEEWMQIANCAPVWSEGLLKFRSYGDKTTVGNGATFSPTTAPVYDLDSDDFICAPGDQPIKVSRPSVRDAYNQVTVEWMNRGNSYQAETVDEKDDAAIGLYGLRPASPVSLHGITSQLTAQKVANTILKRSVYIRNTYKFSLSAVTYALLEPMDMVTLTKSEQGLNLTPVRITSIQENDGLVLDIEAEEFPWGTASPTANPKQAIGPFGPGYFADPGVVNEPLFFEATAEMTQEVLYTLLMGLSGGPNWGGANVYVSTDGGSSYQFIGVQTGPSTMGALTAPLPAAFDPDDTNTLSVDLTQSLGALDSFTRDEENKFIPLAVVDQELISYRTATLTASFRYDITNFRRGVYNTIISDHKTGGQFAFLNDAMFAWFYGAVNIGRTLLFKFQSFNTAGQMLQDLSALTAYPYFVHGPRLAYPWGTPGAPEGYLTQWRQRNFGIQQHYEPRADGGQTAQFLISGSGIPNAFSDLTQPPGLELTTTATGGDIPGGTTVIVGAWVSDAATGAYTRMTLRSIVIPPGTNTNRIDAAYTTFLVDDTIHIASTYFEDEGWFTPEATFGTGTFQITAVGSIENLVPDQLFDHFVLQATESRHSGVWAGAINAIVDNGDDTCTITFANSTWTTDQFAGRILSLLSCVDLRNMPIMDVEILSNTADTITIPNEIINPVLAPVDLKVGDVCVIRTAASTFSATTIGDAYFVNGGGGQPGTGLDVGAEQGKMCWIIRGTGAGQIRPIADNDTTTLTLTKPWDVIPDGTSVFIIFDPNVQFTNDTIPYLTRIQDYSVPLLTAAFAVDNKIQKTFIVQVLSSDAAGNTSLMPFSPFREIFQPGAPGNAGDFALVISYSF